MAYEVRRSEIFDAWLEGLTDAAPQDAITNRILRIEAGLLGNRKSVGGKVSELKIDVGQAYRLYYTIRDRSVVHLLRGGSKKTQRADIRKANAIVKAMDKSRKAGGSEVRERQAGYAAETDEPEVTEADITFAPFDAADYLERESSQIYILRNALESGRADYIAVALDAVARARARRETGGGRRAPEGSPGRKGKPTLATLTTVLKALGLRLEVVEDRGGGPADAPTSRTA